MIDNNVINSNISVNCQVIAEQKLFHQLFEEQVNSTPKNIALKYGQSEVSFKDLNQRSNKLARYLRKNYLITANLPIALYMEKSEFMIIAILAILKSGGAYIIIEPGSSQDQIAFILRDSDPKLLLTKTEYAKQLIKMVKEFSLKTQVQEIDSSNFKIRLKRYYRSNLTPINTIDNLAYINYITRPNPDYPIAIKVSHKNAIDSRILELLNNC